MTVSITMTKGPDHIHAVCRNWREVRQCVRQWKRVGYVLTKVNRERQRRFGIWSQKGWWRYTEIVSVAPAPRSLSFADVHSPEPGTAQGGHREDQSLHRSTHQRNS